MNLLARTARDVSRIWTTNLGFTIGVAATALLLEVFGRNSRYDLHDLLAVFTLLLLGALVVMRHRRQPISWVEAGASGIRRLGARLRRATFEIGLDLRGNPPVRRGTPPIVLWLAAILGVWTIGAALFASDCPHRLRAMAAPHFYLGYLLLISTIWIGLLGLGLLAAFLPAALIHDRFVGAHSGTVPRPRRRELTTLFVYFTVLALAGALLPPYVALIWCAVALAIYLVICRLPARSDVRFLWRPHGTVRVRSLTWSAWVTWEFLIITLAIFALVLTALGDRISGSTGPETMPVTSLLGLIVAWLSPGALTALLVQMSLGRLHDPARPARPVASMAGVPARGRSYLRRLFDRHGWSVQFTSAKKAPLDVPLELVESKLPTVSDEPHWPLAVTVDELESDAGLWERVRRRDEIQSRRKLISALERLFKLAARRSRSSGSGFWVAPHFWFVGGLMRDSQREADEDFDLADGAILAGTVGPPYHRMLSRAARHHMYQMLRALQVDLIFVEDGVGFRRLRRVLRVLFEVFDVHGGRRQAEEIDFRGLPGTRVLIHDFQFDEPFRSVVYPEPKYDYLGRARILHVFRDRGEQEEPLESPFDFGRTPAPAVTV